LGLSQKEAAKRVGVDPSTLAKWELEESGPNRNNLGVKHNGTLHQILSPPTQLLSRQNASLDGYVNTGAALRVRLEQVRI